MMEFRMDAAFLQCPYCQETILLPRQSPLGIYVGLEYRATPVWPLALVCIRSEQWFEGKVAMIRQASQEIADQDRHSPVLWEIDCGCDRENCPNTHAIYAWYHGDAEESETKRGIMRANPKIFCGGIQIPLREDRMKVKKL